MDFKMKMSLQNEDYSMELDEIMPLKGDKGEKGDPGEKGDAGLSAYEIALKHGFEGTEQEWLDSLNGGTSPDLEDLKGILPLESGGTGAATVEGAWQNLRIYTDISQLGLSYPTTTTKIFQAMPVGSIGFFTYDSKYQTVTDSPVSYGIFSVFYPATERPLLLCQQCISTGSNYSATYFGYYNSSGKKMNWYRVFNGSMQATIAQGGTGATTAEKALENLGAASLADVEQIHAEIGDIESALEAIIGGATE